MNIPTSWHELSISDYQKAHQIITADYDEELDRQIALISALSDIPETQVWQLPGEELKQAIYGLAFLKDIDTMPVKIPRLTLMAGRVFKIQTNIRKLTAGQYIDIAAFVKRGNGEIIPELHNIMAVLTTPLFSRYKGARHEAMARLIQKQMSIATAYPVAVFFCAVSRNFILNLPDFLQKYTQQQMEMMKKMSK
jgi:hypothetical protein